MRILELESRCAVIRTVGSNSAAGFRGQTSDWLEVRFGSRIRDVRFTPKSGHAQHLHQCLQRAISRRRGPHLLMYRATRRPGTPLPRKLDKSAFS